MCDVSQNTGLCGRSCPDLRAPSLRYYGTRPREVEHAGLGYGTRLSGYTAPDLPGG